MNILKSCFFAVSAAVLVACGGGDDTEPSTASTVDKYIGTWSDACDKGSQVVLTVTKTSDTVANVKSVITDYSDASCTVSPVVYETITGTMTIVGSKAISGGITVDKIDSNVVSTIDGAATGKEIIKVSGNQLETGTDAPLDAEGYPNQLSGVIFTKK